MPDSGLFRVVLDTNEQQNRFSELLQILGQASASEIQEMLEEREVIEPETGWIRKQ